MLKTVKIEEREAGRGSLRQRDRQAQGDRLIRQKNKKDREIDRYSIFMAEIERQKERQTVREIHEQNRTNQARHTKDRQTDVQSNRQTKPDTQTHLPIATQTFRI